MSNRRVLLRTALVAVLALVLGGAVCAAEFSADLSQKFGTMTMNGKVWVSGKKMRQEMTMAGKKQTVITRGDKAVTWMLDTAKKEYMEVGQAMADWNDPKMQAELSKMATRKSLGKATVSGYTCDKYLYTYKNKDMGTMTVCVAQKLKYPVLVEGKSKAGASLMELKNVKEGKQSSALFEIPKGYKKAQAPKPPQPKTAPKPPSKMK